MRLVINTMPQDMHGLAVAWALRKRGHEVVYITAEDFPSQLRSTILIEKNGDFQTSWDKYSVAGIDQVDAIWNRRLSRPQVSPSLHSADVDHATRESNLFWSSFTALTDRRVFSVNPLPGRLRANSKSVQLVEAGRVGLRIPKTVITNDPEQVSALYKNCNGMVVHKNFTSHCWANDETSYFNFTAPLTDELVSNDQSIILSPGIYQELVEKTADLRITIMGRTCFVALVTSQNDEIIDSRANASESDGTGLIGDEVLNKCFALMDKLGICFGCFDFALPEDGGDPVFLEVNEMGQWLSYEIRIPNFHMLDAFCDFICSRDPEFVYERTVPLNTMHQYLDTVEARGFKPRNHTREYGIIAKVVTME